MADSTYYRVHYGKQSYSTSDVSTLMDAIKNGAPYASFLATGFGNGKTPAEVNIALGGVAVAIERITPPEKSERRAVILR